MSRARIGLTLEEHREVGRALKRARALILDAAAEVRCYARLSDRLSEIADSLIAPRAELERKLFDLLPEQ